jgi:predicted Zn-dependent protease with MMP-like domain
MSTERGNGEGAEPDREYRQLIHAAQDALDDHDPMQAFEIAQQAVARDPMLPDGHFHQGLALLDVGRHRQAYAAFAEAHGLRPGDPELATYEAAAGFILGGVDEAEVTLRRVIGAEPELADAYYWLSLIVERRGEYAEAEELLLRAVSLDPERYHVPFRMERSELEQALREVITSLPDAVRGAIDTLPFVIEDLPSAALLEGHEDHLAPDLLGLFAGASLSEASVFDTSVEPTAVYLFQRNLERVATCREQLLEEARVTLLHEIGHYLGLDEDDLHDRDLA